MDEMERMDRIDALADRMLNREGEERPATEVWDAAAEIVDRRIREALERELSFGREGGE
jgi:hypothetical protein